jgi:penicillin-binding protein 1C
MLRDYGTERFTTDLRRMGMTTLFRPAAEYGLSLVIGGAEGSLWELTGQYRDLALTVTHPDGKLPAALHWRAGNAGAPREAVLDPGAAWLTLQALDEVARPGVESQWRSFRGAESVSWKTGTSQGFRDAWAIGVTPSHVIGVWVGNADGEGRSGLTGYQAAAPVLFDLFDLVRSDSGFPNRPPTSPPSGSAPTAAASLRRTAPTPKWWRPPEPRNADRDATAASSCTARTAARSG